MNDPKTDEARAMLHATLTDVAKGRGTGGGYFPSGTERMRAALALCALDEAEDTLSVNTRDAIETIINPSPPMAS